MEFLQLIYSEIEYINLIYLNDLDNLMIENIEENKKDINEMKKIEVDKYVIPEKNDDLDKLYELLNLILISEKINNIELFKFSNSFIKKFIEFYNMNNLKELQAVNKIINLIKLNDKKFDFKYKDNKDLDLIFDEKRNRTY